MAKGDIVKATITVQNIIWFKNNWGIVSCSLDKSHSGTIVLDYRGNFTLKGSMPTLTIGEQYNLTAKEIYDPKYGLQYEVVCIALTIEKMDNKGQRKFLSRIFTEKQVENMYDKLENPYETLLNEDLQSLVKVRGCGVKSAINWLNRFKLHYSLSKIYIELEDYNLTNNMINKLVAHYNSPDLVIEKVKNNPYVLCEVGGIGWKTADQIALDGGLEEFDEKRVSAYILHYLQTQGENGFSYVPTDELMGGLLEVFGEDIPDLVIAQSIHDMENKLWWNKEKTKIGLMRYRLLEDKLAAELVRIRDAQGCFSYENWMDIVKLKEQWQGWEFTDQQIEGIKTMLDNNVVVIHGLAGTGKSSLVDVMLEVLKDCSCAMCALSGRASARLTEVSNQEGKTIHRLLGFPSMDKTFKQGFTYHDQNKLPYDIIIVDEISMIGGSLFYYLVRAVKTGAKLILLGDIGQLESIGECKVAADLIASPEIATVYLDKIHRQAAKSAIITESIAIRHGQQIIEKDWVGTETRGELQDLILDVYSDQSNTYYKVLQHFSRELESGKNIFDIQIICPIKFKGDACTWNLNLAIQDIYNPASNDKKEIVVHYPHGRDGILRVGDKVMNTKNNYGTVDVDTQETTPVFNGNVGTIYDIDLKNELIVIDFLDIGRIAISKDNFGFIELGYAITCHKIQGQQVEVAIFALDFASYVILSRELLYTGITRAQKKCILIAQSNALRYATTQEKTSQKESHLVDCLNQIAINQSVKQTQNTKINF